MSNKDSANGSTGDGSVGNGGCPAELPDSGAPCDLPSSVMCNYQGGCNYLAECNGVWSVILTPQGGPEVSDASADGEGQDGGHD